MSDPSESASAARAKIFISYRREDCAGHAGRLYDRLCARFGAAQIFMDIDSIEPGEDFVEVIDKTVGSCNVLLAVIGQEWLASSTGGKPRLHNPDDFVRLEIATALRREIRVIPVLVQGAPMPSLQELPDDLKRLVRRNALDVDDLHWHAGIDRLVSTIEKIVEKAGPPPLSATVEKGGSLTSRSADAHNKSGTADPVPESPPRKGAMKYLAAGVCVAIAVAGAALIYSRSGSSPHEQRAPGFGKGTPETTGEHSSKTAPEPSVEAIRRSITIRADRSSEPTDTFNGQERRLYSIWIEAPPETIRRIARVRYHYDHPAFANQKTEQSNPQDGFRDSYNGIGAVNRDMDVIVVLRDGTEVPFKFNMFKAVFGADAE